MQLKRFVRLFFCLFKQPCFLLHNSKVHYSSFVGRNTLLASSQIGKYCYIARGVVMNNTKIGNYVSVAPGVQIGGMEHSYWHISQSTWLSDKCISDNVTCIGNDVWIAAGCIIKQGVTIGDGAVVGANSFVVKDVPPFAIVVGTPAEIMKYRFDENTINHIYQSKYWDYPPQKGKRIIDDIKLGILLKL
ncbi:CatB-related O-acetyltransferase [Bacteroides cutis]|uniref:CatB-related O-acetyltransferase n=1 Tax=Bacteroides cutis TaxID=2024197 RepID=UPI000C767FE5|nr:CatB-related O-acetyltransferase [Bacteroides cutis]